jgi:uroporphyrinogen-III decarboxylase
MSLAFRRDFIYKIFEAQMQIDLASLAKIHDAVGDRAAAIYWTGADFGSQSGTIVSPKTYRDLFFPFHKQVNQWIHQHTSWKTLIHSCGSVSTLIDDFIAAGFDILNPLQCSAANMDPCELKNKFGDRITFWGGGVDTQQTLPFGTPDDVRKEVRERLQRFGPGGSFIFSAIHNIQALVPVANLLALFEAVRDYGHYPL